MDTFTFRGFTIADSFAPFIVINDRDSRAAWSFTLLHELTHLFLGQTGISGITVDNHVEKFCNDVASEVLLPMPELLRQKLADASDLNTIELSISKFARGRRISSSMVAYKLFRAQKITEGSWNELSRRYRQHWLDTRESRRERSRTGDSSGPERYVVKRHRVGKALIGFVDRKLKEGEISTSKAAKLLDVKISRVPVMTENVPTNQAV